jgi:hypothetical protein
MGRVAKRTATSSSSSTSTDNQTPTLQLPVAHFIIIIISDYQQLRANATTFDCNGDQIWVGSPIFFSYFVFFARGRGSLVNLYDSG